MIGQTLSHYRVLDKLGEGGMGEVYLAEDTRLRRKVALKLLPERFASDPRRRKRFVREAIAASALNHPNIGVVYEPGETQDGRPFISMEYVAGETLAVLLGRRQLAIDEVVDIAIAIAEALDEARHHGIVHRDIKPGNVMLDSHRRVKVLDFGIAKVGDPDSRDGTASPTATLDEGVGMLIGTADYMSPEQAHGRPVDHRSDLFSLGVVLYEMVSGHHPFAGTSSEGILTRITQLQPERLVRTRPDCPPELDRIVFKCLEKDVDRRYQTARELLLDLQNVKRSTGAGTQRRAISPPLWGLIRPRVWRLGALAALLVLAASAAWWWRPRNAITAAAPRPQIRRLTHVGDVVNAAMSPDGKYIAYARSDRVQQSLWLQQIGAPNAVQIRPPERAELWGQKFSPDGRFIYHGYKTRENPAGKLVRIPTLGGTAIEILSNIESSISFSPDGSQFAFLRKDFPTPVESALLTANLDGTGIRVIATRREPEFFVPLYFNAPSWSPDGQWIACSVGRSRGQPLAEFRAFRSDGSEEKQLSDHQWVFAGMPQWLSDGKGLVAIASDEFLSNLQIWLLPYPSGPPKRITLDALQYRLVDLTSDSKSLLTIAMNVQSAVWRVPLSQPVTARIPRPIRWPTRLTSERFQCGPGAAEAPDGRIIFSAVEGGRATLWISGHEGSGARPLFAQELDGRFPATSRNGDVAFITRTSHAASLDMTPTSHAASLATAQIDGSRLRILAPATSSAPTFTPDGRFIIFTAPTRGRVVLFKISPDGGAPVKLTDYFTHSPAVSPNGKWIAAKCVVIEGGPPELCVLPITGGPPVHRFPLSTDNETGLAWAPDGSGVFTTDVQGDPANVYLQPLDGSPPRPATSFEDLLIHRVGLAENGKSLLIVRSEMSRDAYLLTNFR